MSEQEIQDTRVELVKLYVGGLSPEKIKRLVEIYESTDYECIGRCEPLVLAFARKVMVSYD